MQLVNQKIIYYKIIEIILGNILFNILQIKENNIPFILK